MLTGEIRSQVNAIGNSFWSGGISNLMEVMEQITYLLLLHRLDDEHTLDENKSVRLGKPTGRQPSVFTVASPAETERSILLARVFPADLNACIADNAANVPDSDTSGDIIVLAKNQTDLTAELARALKHDPGRIYEYVHDNIEYIPICGLQKGALGTAFDQAALMAGAVAPVHQGQHRQRPHQPDRRPSARLAGHRHEQHLRCEETVSSQPDPRRDRPRLLADRRPLGHLKLDHLWVKATIGGANYVFDPSYKAHTIKPGVDLAAAYLASAKSGSTLTKDYVQELNRSNILKNLDNYINTLAK